MSSWGEGIEAGGDDFLTKPHNRLVLGARVRSLLKLKAATDALEQWHACAALQPADGHVRLRLAAALAESGRLHESRASAVIAPPGVEAAGCNLLVCRNPYLAFAAMLASNHVLRKR